MDISNLEEVICEDKYGHKRTHIKCCCEECKKEFLSRKDFVLKRSGKFCSRECFYSNKKKLKVKIICAACGKEKYMSQGRANKKTKYGLKFCSLDCKNKSQCIGGLIQPPSYKIKSTNDRTKSPDGLCLNCNKLLTDGCLAYCSKECQKNKKYSEYIDKWKNNEVSGNYSNEEMISNYVRKYMLDKAGNKCQECGWDKINKKTGKRPLNINHIDGNSNNSSETNLEVLCPNCHSLTHNYGSLNKGKGRKGRLSKIRDKVNRSVP